MKHHEKKHEKHHREGKHAMHGDHNLHHKEPEGRHHRDRAGTDTHWDGGAELGTKGERWEGTGAHCRHEAAERGFGKK